MSESPFKILYSTSAAKCADDCRRKRYWQYEHSTGSGVRGIERVAMALPLATGIYVHQGLAVMLATGDVDQGVKEAVGEYRAECATRGLNAEVAADVAFTVEEQAALIEGLIRAWARARREPFLAEYEVLDIEREELCEVRREVGLMSRSDVVLRRKSDRRVFIVNFKSVGDAGERWRRSFEFDVQTMSETVPVERRLGEQVAGVLIEGLVKGRREGVNAEGKVAKQAKNKEVVRYLQWSPLLQGYKLAANPPLDDGAYSHEYTSAKGWSRFLVREEQAFGSQPTRHWVEEVLPIEVVEAVCVSLPPILRLERLVEDWLEQSSYREVEFRAARDYLDQQVDSSDEQVVRSFLNREWPQTFAACDRFGPCAMTDVCFNEGVAADPIGSGLYRPRKSHHPIEEENA